MPFSQFGIKVKDVRDPLYDFIGIPIDLLTVVDHPLFQRLRWVSQLPLEQHVYPSAQHSRFEHSLGVMHLAMKAAVALLRNSEERVLNILADDDSFPVGDTGQAEHTFILAAGLSGLLHDVGHAPFSHTLEDACDYVAGQGYDHERIGYVIATNILSGRQ